MAEQPRICPRRRRSREDFVFSGHRSAAQLDAEPILDDLLHGLLHPPDVGSGIDYGVSSPAGARDFKEGGPNPAVKLEVHALVSIAVRPA